LLKLKGETTKKETQNNERIYFFFLNPLSFFLASIFPFFLERSLKQQWDLQKGIVFAAFGFCGGGGGGAECVFVSRERVG